MLSNNKEEVFVFRGCVDQKFFKNHLFLMQVSSCTSKIILFSLPTAVCLVNVKNHVVQHGSEPAFLPKDFRKVELKAVFNTMTSFVRKPYSNDGNLTIILISD